MTSGNAKDVSGGGTEERLRQVVIGDLKPINGSVVLVPYERAWPREFDIESARIRIALGPRALRVEHVGSTSVPGMRAKPIIDILLVVPDSSREPDYVPAMEAVGYVLRIREPDWKQHRLFKGPDREVNVHVFSEGSDEVGRMIGFRDLLRSNRSEFELYAATKARLAARHWKFTQEYADAKSKVVESILARAQPTRPTPSTLGKRRTSRR